MKLKHEESLHFHPMIDSKNVTNEKFLENENLCQKQNVPKGNIPRK